MEEVVCFFLMGFNFGVVFGVSLFIEGSEEVFGVDINDLSIFLFEIERGNGEGFDVISLNVFVWVDNEVKVFYNGVNIVCVVVIGY